MLDSIYVGLTGLIGYSKDLTVVGNNVANLNTPGFKSAELTFSDLFYQSQLTNEGQSRFDLGAGVETGATRRSFQQGELRQTSSDLDAAIDGNGFFVLRKDGDVFYTRAGQFSFDQDGFLVSQVRDARVAALAQGALTDISINGLRTNPGKATSKAEFVGILNINDQSSAPHTVSNVTVFDSVGVGHVLSVKFTNNNSVTPRSWLVEAKDDKDKVLTSGEIRFNADGTPAAGFNSLAFSLAPEGVAASMVTLFFGDPGATSGARSIAVANSDLQLDKQDGFAVGSLTKTTFDERGVLMLTYSNGQTTKHERLALASFSFLQRLEPREGGLFVSADDSDRLLGSASEGPFGGIAAGRVEISNVDLAQEFSDLIISQRGYQASSQVISSANEMMQQLFDIKARR